VERVTQSLQTEDWTRGEVEMFFKKRLKRKDSPVSTLPFDLSRLISFKKTDAVR